MLLLSLISQFFSVKIMVFAYGCILKIEYLWLKELLHLFSSIWSFQGTINFILYLLALIIQSKEKGLSWSCKNSSFFYWDKYQELVIICAINIYINLRHERRREYATAPYIIPQEKEKVQSLKYFKLTPFRKGAHLKISQNHLKSLKFSHRSINLRLNLTSNKSINKKHGFIRKNNPWLIIMFNLLQSNKNNRNLNHSQMRA